MNTEPQDPIWERLSRALFGIRRTTDEGLFTFRVMQEIRQLQPALGDLAWHRFLRFAVPALGVGVASLVLATRTPALLIEDPVNVTMEDF
jgi:hypothetical protein